MGWLDKYQDGGVIKAQKGYNNERYQAVKEADNTSVKSPKQFKELSEEQKAAIAQQILNEQTGIIEEIPDPYSWDALKRGWNQGVNIMLNPATAAREYVEKGYVPYGFEKGKRNTTDYAVDVINPTQYIYDAKNVVEGITKADGEKLAWGIAGIAPLGTEAGRMYKTYKNSISKLHSNLSRNTPSPNFYENSLADLPFNHPEQKFSDIPLSKDMEPWLSRYEKPISREQEIFESFLSPTRQNEKIANRIVHLDREGNVIEPIYRGVYLNDEIRNSPKFKGKSDEEILNIMGTTIPGSTNTRRKGQFNQTLNFGRDRESAIRHIGKHTDPNSLQTLGNTSDFTSGDMYVLKVQPKYAPFLTSEQQSKIYKKSISNWKKQNNKFIIDDEAKEFPIELFNKHYGESPYYRTEGVNVIDGNFPQFLGKEGESIGELLEANKISREDYLNLLNKEPKKPRPGLFDTKKEMAYGGVIKDNRGQWAHPGKVTEIDSNNISMQGVNYPVLGISNTGDTKMMMPGENYKFQGSKVTEYPIKAQDGKKLKLSYNDWLSKYNLEETDDYNMKGAYEAGYIPDSTGHLPSINYKTLEFLKKSSHPTIHKELEWYNSDDGKEFKKMYDIDSISNKDWWRYTPKKMQNGGWLDKYEKGGIIKAQGGANIDELKLPPYIIERNDGDYDLLPHNLPESNKLDHEKEWMKNWYNNRDKQFNDSYSFDRERESSFEKWWDKTFNTEEELKQRRKDYVTAMKQKAVNNINSVKIKGNVKIPGNTYMSASYGSYSPYYHDIHFPMYLKDYDNVPKETAVHELSHSSGVQGLPYHYDLIKKARNTDKYKNSKIRDKGYYGSSDEINSRIFEVRRLLNLDPKEEITEEILNKKMKEHNKKNLDELDLMFDRSTIIELLNKLVSNDKIDNSTKNITQYAEKGKIVGGWLDKYNK